MNKSEINIENRRQFLLDSMKMLSAGACMLTAIGTLDSCEFDLTHPVRRDGIDIDYDVKAEPLLAKKGGGVIKPFPGVNLGLPVIIINIGDDNYSCFSSLCTHDSCFGDKLWLQSPLGGIINCSCHGSQFDPKTGEAIKGPAERPLKQYSTDYNPETGILTIHF